MLRQRAAGQPCLLNRSRGPHRRRLLSLLGDNCLVGRARNENMQRRRRPQISLPMMNWLYDSRQGHRPVYLLHRGRMRLHHRVALRLPRAVLLRTLMQMLKLPRKRAAKHREYHVVLPRAVEVVQALCRTSNRQISFKPH